MVLVSWNMVMVQFMRDNGGMGHSMEAEPWLINTGEKKQVIGKMEFPLIAFEYYC